MSRGAERDAEELFEHRDDPGEWSEEPADVTVKPSRSEVVSFRLPPNELDALEGAASASGESVSEYIRKSLALRLFGEPIGPAVEITSDATRLTIRSHIIVSRRKDAPASFVPDVPPLTAATI